MVLCAEVLLNVKNYVLQFTDRLLPFAASRKEAEEIDACERVEMKREEVNR